MAAGRDMNARLIVRLQDRFSAGLSGLQGRLDRITASMRRLSAVAAIGAGLALAGPISQAAALDQSLRDIALTAGAAGPAVQRMIRDMQAPLQRLARETGQTMQDVTGGYGILIAAGMERTIADRAMPLIARFATAANASIADVANMVFSASTNMRVPMEQMEGFLASLMVAGREGRFEVRDMAREFNTLGARMQALGVTGNQAGEFIGAGLQVAMRGAATPAEAANNLADFLDKLAAPDVRRNLREIGIDVEAVFANARRLGRNPIEAMVQRLAQATGGELFRVSEVFGDRQARGFLLPLLQNRDEFIRIRGVMRASNPSLIWQSFVSQMEGPSRQLSQFYVNLTDLATRLGSAFSEGLVPVNEALSATIEFLERMDQSHPGLIEKVLRFGMVLGGAAAALATIVTVGGFVLGALAPLAAFMTGPFGLAIAAVAAAAWLIYDNWDTIVGLFNRVRAAWDRFWNSEQMQETGRVFSAIGRGIGEAWERVGQVFRLVGEAIATTFRTIMADLQPIIDAITWVLDRLPRMRGEGQSGPVAPQGQANFGGRGGASGYYGPEAALPPGTFPGDVRVGGEIVVRAAPGAEIVSTNSRNPSVPVTPDRGAMVARP